MIKSDINKYIHILEKCILFKGIDINQSHHIIDCLSPIIKNYKSGSAIAIEGDVCPGTCIVLSGEITISKALPSGESNIMNVACPGEIFGEVTAFTEQKNWPASVYAREDSEIMIIPSKKFIKTCAHQCSEHTKLTENMLIIISEKVVLLNKKMSYLMLKSLRNKICLYLLEQQKLEKSSIFLIPFSRDELAEFLNVTRPSLSRELGKMRDEGIIDFHRSTIKVLKPELIVEYASNK